MDKKNLEEQVKTLLGMKRKLEEEYSFVSDLISGTTPSDHIGHYMLNFDFFTDKLGVLKTLRKRLNAYRTVSDDRKYKNLEKETEHAIKHYDQLKKQVTNNIAEAWSSGEIIYN